MFCNSNVQRLSKKSVERKIELDAYGKKKKPAKAASVPTSSAIKHEPDAAAGCYSVKLDHAVDSVALGESGSDFIAINRTLLSKLISNNKELKTTVYKAPMNLKSAINGTNEVPINFVAKTSVTSVVTIFIPSSNQPVIIKAVELIVVNQDMEEVLLGRPFLNSIEFCIQKHLETVDEASTTITSGCSRHRAPSI